MLFSYLKYLFDRRDEHSLHSPFVYDLYQNIIKNKRPQPEYQAIEAIRKALKKDKRLIDVTDFGAGSKRNKKNLRTVASIAKSAEKAPKFAQLFYRLIDWFDFEYIIDLGTSLGITTAYLAIQTPQNKVFSFEGCPQTAAIAQENFNKLALKNIELIQGNIDETLLKKIADIKQIDFAFFDANHRYEPTLRYFETCLSKAHENSLFVFDDIYWSNEMTEAWQQIKQHQRVRITIDLYFIGLVFFRKKQEKQDYTLKF